MQLGAIEKASIAATLSAGSRVFGMGINGDDLASIVLGGDYCVASSHASAFDLSSLLPNGSIDTVICVAPDARPDARFQLALQTIRWQMRAGGTLFLTGPACQFSPDLKESARAAGFCILPSPLHSWVYSTTATTGPFGLALQVHARDADARLNLKWTPDEIDFLTSSPADLWAPLLGANVVEVACDYALHDPWGSLRTAPVLSSFFGFSLTPTNIVLGAGVSGILRQLAGLVRHGRLLTTPFVHRDFLIWTQAEGAEIDWIPEDSDLETFRQRVEQVLPHVLFLERPSPLGSVMELDHLASLCALARRIGCFVLVDEAYHSYFGGANSSVLLLARFDNLIVMRSLSKAYCAGGLRMGFACGRGVAGETLRKFVAPLQVSELAIRMGHLLLNAGDIFRELRRRIAQVKAETVSILADMGLSCIPGASELPWLLIDDPTGAAYHQLEAIGISGKQIFSSASGEAAMVRLSIPLAPHRVDLFRSLMGRVS